MTQDNSRTVHVSWFKFTLQSSWNFEFSVNHILQVSCDWILHCDCYALHGAGATNCSMAMSQTALWPCLPSVQNRVWPCKTTPSGGAHTVYFHSVVAIMQLEMKSHTTYLPRAAQSFLSGSVESLKAAREYECTLVSIHLPWNRPSSGQEPCHRVLPHFSLRSHSIST